MRRLGGYRGWLSPGPLGTCPQAGAPPSPMTDLGLGRPGCSSPGRPQVAPASPAMAGGLDPGDQPMEKWDWGLLWPGQAKLSPEPAPRLLASPALPAPLFHPLPGPLRQLCPEPPFKAFLDLPLSSTWGQLGGTTLCRGALGCRSPSAAPG